MSGDRQRSSGGGGEPREPSTDPFPVITDEMLPPLESPHVPELDDRALAELLDELEGDDAALLGTDGGTDGGTGTESGAETVPAPKRSPESIPDSLAPPPRATESAASPRAAEPAAPDAELGPTEREAEPGGNAKPSRNVGPGGNAEPSRNVGPGGNAEPSRNVGPGGNAEPSRNAGPGGIAESTRIGEPCRGIESPDPDSARPGSAGPDSARSEFLRPDSAPPAPPRAEPAQPEPPPGPARPPPPRRPQESDRHSGPRTRLSAYGPVIESEYGVFRPPVARPREEPGLTGLTRRSRSKFGSWLFTVAFVVIFLLIVVQAIAGLLSAGTGP